LIFTIKVGRDVAHSDRYALAMEALLDILLLEELSDIHIRKEIALPRPSAPLS